MSLSYGNLKKRLLAVQASWVTIPCLVFWPPNAKAICHVMGISMWQAGVGAACAAAGRESRAVRGAAALGISVQLGCAAAGPAPQCGQRCRRPPAAGPKRAMAARAAGQTVLGCRQRQVGLQAACRPAVRRGSKQLAALCARATEHVPGKGPRDPGLRQCCSRIAARTAAATSTLNCNQADFQAGLRPHTSWAEAQW